MTFDLTRIRLYRARADYRSLILNSAVRKAGGPNGAFKEDHMEYQTCKDCGYYHAVGAACVIGEFNPPHFGEDVTLSVPLSAAQWEALVKFARTRSTTPALLVKELMYMHIIGFLNGVREGLTEAREAVTIRTEQ